MAWDNENKLESNSQGSEHILWDVKKIYYLKQMFRFPELWGPTSALVLYGCGSKPILIVTTSYVSYKMNWFGPRILRGIWSSVMLWLDYDFICLCHVFMKFMLCWGLSRILTDTTLRRSHNWPHWRRSGTWPQSFPLYWRRSPQWCHTQWLLLLQSDIDHLQVWAFKKNPTGAKAMLMSDKFVFLYLHHSGSDLEGVVSKSHTVEAQDT